MIKVLGYEYAQFTRDRNPCKERSGVTESHEAMFYCKRLLEKVIFHAYTNTDVLKLDDFPGLSLKCGKIWAQR